MREWLSTSWSLFLFVGRFSWFEFYVRCFIGTCWRHSETACIFSSPTRVVLPAAFDTANPAHVGDGAKLCSNIVSSTDSIVQVADTPTQSGSPLSYQERSWLGGEQRLGFRPASGKSGTYNIFIPLRLSGVLNIDALEAALTEVVRRHENLRTRITVAESQPLRYVGTGARVAVRLVDLSAFSDRSREDEVSRFTTEAVVEGFDLMSGLLLRAWAFRLGVTEHVLVLVVPHLVSDAASLGILAEETMVLYAHFINRLASPLPELAVQYRSFVEMQRERVERERAGSIRDYYLRKLAGSRPLRVPPPPGRARSGFGGDAGEIEFEIPAPLAERLATHTKVYRVTPFVLFLSAFKLLLSALSGEEDVLVMSQFPGRPEPYARVVGLFAQLCHLRTSMAGDPTLAEAIARVRDTIFEAWQYEWVPPLAFAEVAESEGGKLSPFSATMNSVPIRKSVLPRRYQHLLKDQLEISLEPFKSLDNRVARPRAWTDLYIYLYLDGKKVVSRVLYRTDLFEGDRIQHVTSGFITVLDRMLSDPACRLSALSRLLTAA